MSEPIHHHYLPAFYLTRWAGNDGCVARFNRPYGKEVKAKRVSPKGTGFEPHLYQAMEKDFMAKLDTKAAEALALLERGLPEEQWTPVDRSAWSRFVHAQMLRTPEDIAQLKSSVNQEWVKAIPQLSEEDYAARRSEADPPTVREYIEKRRDEFAFGVARTMMDHSGVGQLLNNMHWLVLDVAPNDVLLLTSDRPVWMTATLTEEDAFLVMPIGPTKLFTATVKSTTQEKLKQRRRRDLVKEVNKIIVQHAVKYVYAQTDGALRFVQNHMATKRHSTLLERVAAARGHGIIAADSPMASGPIARPETIIDDKEPD
jgi:hypothetical protein